MTLFDPYRDWLNIAPEHRPANHYRLLGLEPFESDPRVITEAAVRRAAHVRGFEATADGDVMRSILNQLAAAKECLVDEKTKALYDQKLRRRLGIAEPTLKKTGEKEPTVTEAKSPGRTPDARPAASGQKSPAGDDVAAASRTAPPAPIEAALSSEPIAAANSGQDPLLSEEAQASRRRLPVDLVIAYAIAFAVGLLIAWMLY